MYVEIPAVEGTALTRIAALGAARELLKEEPATSKASMFGGETHSPGSVAGPSALIRLATYIETGHDYKDTHPEGKRRPVIKQITNVTVMAPQGADPEDLEHLLSHVEDGSFADFMRDMVQQQEAAHGAASAAAEEGPVPPADEPEHQPQVDGDRPRFA